MTRRLISGVLILLALAPVALFAQQQPKYLDPSQPLEQRVDDLISRLSLSEKISLLSTTAPAIPRLKVPVMNGWNQSLHGIVWTKPTTMFPVPISMAATWNPTLVKDVAAAIADEGRAMEYGVDTRRDVVGFVERIGPQRWRLVMPRPHFESQLDVMELVPAS